MTEKEKGRKRRRKVTERQRERDKIRKKENKENNRRTEIPVKYILFKMEKETRKIKE